MTTSKGGGFNIYNKIKLSIKKDIFILMIKSFLSRDKFCNKWLFTTKKMERHCLPFSEFNLIFNLTDPFIYKVVLISSIMADTTRVLEV